MTIKRCAVFTSWLRKPGYTPFYSVHGKKHLVWCNNSKTPGSIKTYLKHWAYWVIFWRAPPGNSFIHGIPILQLHRLLRHKSAISYHKSDTSMMFHIVHFPTIHVFIITTLLCKTLDIRRLCSTMSEGSEIVKRFPPPPPRASKEAVDGYTMTFSFEWKFPQKWVSTALPKPLTTCSI